MTNPPSTQAVTDPDYRPENDGWPASMAYDDHHDVDPDYVPEPPQDLPQGLMCGRCYDFVDEVFPAPCTEDPEALAGAPLGQYHCPDCGAMVVAGLPHPRVCRLCLERRAPGIDVPIPGLDVPVPLHP